jgi:hypothetical protein
MQIFEHKGYTHDMVYNIIRRLKEKGEVVKSGKYNWVLNDKVDNGKTTVNVN